MTNTTITNFRKNVFEYVNQAIQYNSPVSIITKQGNAVVISEEDYLGMLATLELMREPGLVDAIQAGRQEPLETCAPYDPGEEW